MNTEYIYTTKLESLIITASCFLHKLWTCFGRYACNHLCRLVTCVYIFYKADLRNSISQVNSEVSLFSPLSANFPINGISWYCCCTLIGNMCPSSLLFESISSSHSMPNGLIWWELNPTRSEGRQVPHPWPGEPTEFTSRSDHVNMALSQNIFHRVHWTW